MQKEHSVQREYFRHRWHPEERELSSQAHHALQFLWAAEKVRPYFHTFLCAGPFT